MSGLHTLVWAGATGPGRRLPSAPGRGELGGQGSEGAGSPAGLPGALTSWRRRVTEKLPAGSGAPLPAALSVPLLPREGRCGVSMHPHFLSQLGGVAASAPLILQAELPGQRSDLWEVRRCQCLRAPSPEATASSRAGLCGRQGGGRASGPRKPLPLGCNGIF